MTGNGHERDAGAYALGALDADETAAFEAALAHSEELRADVAGFVDTAALLGLAAPPVTPPPAMKAELLARLASTPQLPKMETAPAEHFTVAPVTPITAGRHQVGRRPVRSARSRVLLALSAAAAAVVLFGGGALAGGLLDSVSSERQADQFAALNAAPDVQRTVTELPDGGTASLVSSESLHLSAVVLDGDIPVPDGKTMQLWYVDEHGAVSAGLIEPDGSGPVYTVLKGEYAGTEQVAMTVEPKGGSKKPTSTPLLLTA